MADTINNTDNTTTQDTTATDVNTQDTTTDTTAVDNTDTVANDTTTDKTADTTATDTTDADTANADDSTETINDTNDAEAQIAELYVATFDRAPDAAGLQYWVEQHKKGMSIEDIAKSFFDQPETKEKYANADLETFIESVYEHVLDRKADQAGLEYWKGELEKGHISKDKFIIAILNGAKEHQDDHKHLLDKVDVGLTFVKEGLNDPEMAKTVIAQFKELKDKDAVKEALKTFVESHKGENKFDKDDLVSFENITHQKHQELMKEHGKSDIDDMMGDKKDNDKIDDSVFDKISDKMKGDKDKAEDAKEKADDAKSNDKADDAQDNANNTDTASNSQDSSDVNSDTATQDNSSDTSANDSADTTQDNGSSNTTATDTDSSSDDSYSYDDSDSSSNDSSDDSVQLAGVNNDNGGSDAHGGDAGHM